jgi:hypothetical protein
METHIVANEWSTVLRHPDLLELRWLPTTSMTDAAFMTTLCMFVSAAEAVRPRGLLIDAREFSHRFGDGMMAWRDAHIIPRYGAAGVRKFAFVMPARFPDAGKQTIEGPAVFPTRWFTDRDEALGWLGAMQ